MQIQGKYRCINCFNELNTENEICSCGYDIAQYKTAMHRLSPGTVLDNRYYIGRVIGEGGFGITYVGYDANLEMRVAIKEFFLSGVNTRNTTYSDEIESSAEEKEALFETYREKFINEARVLAKFNNEEGIVTVYNFFKANNTAYIIMEFLDGQNLKEYLKSKGKLSTDEVIEIFIPIMRTLDKVHTAKLIHRDISPDNIIFTKNDIVKLLDFGAARDVSDDNKSLSVVLKHGYAPPEQYQTHGKQGPWTDVYALSATIYKCLTGKAPIEAMDRTLGEELEPIFVITSDCSQEVSDVIMKGLEVKISDRYQSIGEMADDLKKAHMRMGDEQKPFVKEDTEATVLIVDENRSKVSDDQVGKREEVKKQDEALDRKNVRTRENNNETTVIDIKEHNTNQKVKATSKKSIVLIIATIVLCAIVGLLAIVVVNREKLKSLYDDSPVTVESTEESLYAYLKSAHVGDIVEFGNYNGFSTWRVLAKNDKELMLITEKVVDRQAFNEENVKCDWSSCTLRTWLNEEYYNNAFTDAEKSLIKESDIDEGRDRIFLLSSKESKALFKDENDRIAHNSEYEKEEGIDAPYGYSWWLRSSVFINGHTYDGGYINSGGYVRGAGISASNDNYGVRPALNIDLSKIGVADLEDVAGDIQKLVNELEDDVYYENNIAEGEKTTEKMVEGTIESTYAYLKTAQVGNIVEFGNYNGFTTWRVFAKDDTNLMLITENVVDGQPFNTEYVKCDWSSCTLRTWLNEDYYNSAFTDGEKSLIKESDIDGGKDKIFLLSSVEAKTYFKSDDDRIAHNTEIEKKWGVEEPYGIMWWLRSPVYSSVNSYIGSFVDGCGYIYECENFVGDNGLGVRPALNIDISNL